MNADEFATQLHSLLCKDNHTDGCDWYYGNFYAKERYRKLSERLITEKFDPATILNILSIIKKEI